MIASAMDVIFAADNTRFLPTNFQYFSVPWDLGVRRAKEVLFQSRFLSAQDGYEYGFVNRVVPLAQLDEEVMEYADSVAQNDPFQLRMIKLAINQAQDAQGFTQHIYGAFGLHILSSIGESDPTADLPQIEGRRRPMVQRAIENQRRAEARRNRRST
jgi:enoyl-CoA hydratase